MKSRASALFRSFRLRPHGNTLAYSAVILLALAPVWAAAGATESARPLDHVDHAGGCEDGEESLARVQARYDSIADLEASFEQRTEALLLAGTGGVGAEASRGKVLLAKPGRMRWSYEEPEPSLVVSDGETLWVYDPSAGQVTRVRMGGGYPAGAALQFLFGSGQLREVFSAEVLGCGPAGVEIGLVPREAASFERLSLIVSPDDSLIRETSIVDLFGNRTTIRFSEIVLNKSPSPELFDFEPPVGTELLELSAEAR